MVKHIVAFKLLDPADAPAMAAILAGLAGEPGVCHWEVGVNSGSSSRPYEVVVSELDDMASLETFRTGAAHTHVKDAIARYIETSGTIDYER